MHQKAKPQKMSIANDQALSKASASFQHSNGECIMLACHNPRGSYTSRSCSHRNFNQSIIIDDNRQGADCYAKRCSTTMTTIEKLLTTLFQTLIKDLEQQLLPTQHNSTNQKRDSILRN